jgi:hypothetical protein
MERTPITRSHSPAVEAEVPLAHRTALSRASASGPVLTLRR